MAAIRKMAGALCGMGTGLRYSPSWCGVYRRAAYKNGLGLKLFPAPKGLIVVRQGKGTLLRSRSRIVG
jgi:hypothetical protein